MLSSFLVTISIAAQPPQQYSLEDLLQYKCEHGNSSACAELKSIAAQKKEAEYLQSKVDGFAEKLASMDMMLDEKRPDLQSAYPLVMHDYFQGLQDLGKQQPLLTGAELEACASHYHNHWINKKLWWPNDEGKPDWADIYVYIVDHYYGFCLKSRS